MHAGRLERRAGRALRAGEAGDGGMGGGAVGDVCWPAGRRSRRGPLWWWEQRLKRAGLNEALFELALDQGF